MATFDLSPGALDAQMPMDPLQYAVASRDRDVLSIVRNALDRGNTMLAFQPVVRAGDANQVAFYEGLIRVLDEGGRIVPARQFMDQIAENALGRDVDCETLRHGLDMLQANPTLRLSLNVSARSIGDAAWRRRLDQRLDRDPALAHRLILEIGETSAMQLHEMVIRFMEEMQPCGVAFALDDFGGGMTAFRHLKDFFFDMVKLDRCFVSGINHSPDNQVLAEALITVAHQFEMFAVAQGVETAAEAEFLASFGVDCLQGYHIGIPKFTL